MHRPSPRAMYRAEKEKALRERSVPHAELMAEAKEAFEKMLAEGKAARKSGRPKRVIPPPAAEPAPRREAAGKAAPAAPKPAPAATPARPASAPAKPVGKRAPARKAKAKAKASGKTASTKRPARKAASGRGRPKAKSAAKKSASKRGRKR